MNDDLVRKIIELEQRLQVLETAEMETWITLTAPLTSTSWDGDARSTASKTLIDLSAVFGVPAGVRAILCIVSVRDSGSASNDCYIILSPNSTSGSGVAVSTDRITNDVYTYRMLVVPCNSDGDIYFQTVASGSGTLDVDLDIWGYLL